MYHDDSRTRSYESREHDTVWKRSVKCALWKGRGAQSIKERSEKEFTIVGFGGREGRCRSRGKGEESRRDEMHSR